MLEKNKNLEKQNSKIRKILKWVGILFIIFGVLIPIILILKGFTAVGYSLPAFFGITKTFTPGFIALGIILILIEKILKKPTPKTKILLIIFIILLIPFVFKATVGTIVGCNSVKENTIIKQGATEVSEERLKEITDKAVVLNDANECKKLLPFHFLPPFLASRLLPDFCNPYPITGITITKRWGSMGPLYHIYVEGFTDCVAEVAKKKGVQICEEFGPFIETDPSGWSLSYPFDKDKCEQEVYLQRNLQY